MDKKNPGSEPGFESNGNLEQVFNTSNPPPQSTPPFDLLSAIARFIYDAAARQVWEIALPAAIGFLAGICGRAYNIGGCGLNLYMIVLADTGRGKDAMAGGIAKLISAVKQSSPTISDYVGPSHIASSQALSKWLARQPCIFSIVDELGTTLRHWTSEKAPPHLAMLKTDLLSLFHRSGHGDTWGAMAYAKREENTVAVNSPSFTLIGDSTPDKFLGGLNEGLVGDGLIPRFVIFRYDGDQPPLNPKREFAKPSRQLVETLGSLVAQATSISQAQKVCNVGMSPEAQTILDDFEAFARNSVNNRDPKTGIKLPKKANNVVKELWNRAHIKAMKLAGLRAIGVNYLDPIVDAEQAKWACDQITAQTTALIKNFDDGEIGEIEDNELLRRKSLIKAILQYMETPFDQLPKYGAREELHRARTISRGYLQLRLACTTPFKKASFGPTKALDATIKNMLDADELREIPKNQMVEKYGTYARAFQISDLDAFYSPDENKSAPSACGHSKGVFFP